MVAAAPSPLELCLASAVMALGALVQGSVGFGAALVGAPLLILIHPALVPGPIIAAGLLLTLLMTLREHQAIDPSGMGWAILGRVPGTAVGALAVALLPARPLALAFGAIVLLAVALSASGGRVRMTRWSLLGTGALSGVMGTTTSIGGPPVALLYQDASGPALRGTLAGYFLVSTVMSLAALAAVGHFGGRELRWSAALLPGIALGFALSNRTTRLFDRGYTRPAVLGLSALAGIAVILRVTL